MGWINNDLFYEIGFILVLLVGFICMLVVLNLGNDRYCFNVDYNWIDNFYNG